MTKLYVLVGLPSSGKSTYTKGFKGNVFSSDAIRAELYGDEAIQGDAKEVFRIMYKRTAQSLASGIDTIYDATNLTPKARRGILNFVGSDVEKIAVVMGTPYEVCLDRNAKRERQVPTDVMERMLKSFKFPLESEGFDKIELFYDSPELKNYYGSGMEDIMLYQYDFDQNTPWHPEKYLELHVEQVVEGVKDMEDWVIDAAYVHDIGKPFCEEKDDAGISHFYGHASVSAHMSLFFGLREPIKVAQLVSYHMDAHSWEKSPRAAKCFESKEPVLYQYLVRFAKADREAIKTDDDHS